MSVLTSQLSSERLTPAAARPDGPLRALPSAERNAVCLARVRGLTYREVAVVLGISEDAAKRQIRSGLQRLRAEMVRSAPVAS